MFEVKIINESKMGSPWKGVFNTLEEATTWMNQQKTKPGRSEEEATYIGPIDLTQDDEWVNEQVKQKRQAEYPDVYEVIEALMESIVEGRDQKLQEVQAKRIAVKNKYPQRNKDK